MQEGWKLWKENRMNETRNEFGHCWSYNVFFLKYLVIYSLTLLAWLATIFSWGFANAEVVPVHENVQWYIKTCHERNSLNNAWFV